MRKNIFGRRFKRDINERKALIKSLLTSLVIHERIETTEEKAKSIKADADKLITRAKKGGLHSYTLVQPLVHAEAVSKLLNDLAPRFADRAGGYTRVIKTQRRFNDNARMAYIEWTEKTPVQTAIIRADGSKKVSKKKDMDTQTSLTASSTTEKITIKKVLKEKITKKTSKKEPKA